MWTTITIAPATGCVKPFEATGAVKKSTDAGSFQKPTNVTEAVGG
jgi:hypothetical protein